MKMTRTKRSVLSNQMQSKRQFKSAMVVEPLESRQMLSASVYQAQPTNSAVFSSLATPGKANPAGFSPETIRNVYGLDKGSTNQISFNGLVGDGTGQTIAIVDAFDNPNLVSTSSSSFSTSDLAKFDAYYKLPNPPSFTKIDEFGSTTSYPTAPATADGYGWANEEALDVEWVHAMAPKANIVLVEAYSDTVYPSGTSDLLRTAVLEAAKYSTSSVPGASVVTMSFAVSEFSGETGYDQNFVTPSGHVPITFVAASGDITSSDTDSAKYPAVSPSVVGVGGTSLTVNGADTTATYKTETAVNISGGGISQYEVKPAYQFGVTQSSTMRTTPDVAIDGDKLTGVSVYDSYNGGASTPWYQIGGTSFSAPAWAGIMAVVDQGRVKIGLTALNGASQTLPRLYELNTSAFHDVTSGSNGHYSAGTGYDLVTGLGTPVANLLIPDMVGGGSVKSLIFNDVNGNGKQDSGDNVLVGWGTFIDLYGTGVRQGLDPYALSGSLGYSTIFDLPGGTYHLTQGKVTGYTRVTPVTYYSITSGLGTALTGYLFAEHPSTSTKLTGTVFGTSGSYGNNGNTIAKAVDGNTSTYYDGAAANGNIVGLDFGSAKTIGSLSYTPRSGYASRLIGGYFQASNSSTFASGNVTLYTITSATDGGATISLSLTAMYRYVRYVAPTGSYGNIAEMTFFG